MKKVTQILVALMLSFGLVGVSTTTTNAQATNCDNIVIYNTGPDSNNVALCITDTELEVVCDNNIYVLTDSSQEAVSDAAENQGSTAGGNAVSGSAANENGTTVQIGADCGETPAPTPETVTPETPATPTVTPVATSVEKPTLLPYTATSSPTEALLIGLIALVTAAVTARITIKAYRRIALK